jgi:hypothetical protein
VLDIISKRQNASIRELVLDAIARYGLRGIAFADKGAPEGELERRFFHDTPVWNTALNSYLPEQFNYANVDGAIPHVTSRAPNRKAHLYLIQITTAMKHKNSEDALYRNQWSKWAADLDRQGWDLTSTFIWIDREKPEKTLQPEQVIALRNQDIHAGGRV